MDGSPGFVLVVMPAGSTSVGASKNTADDPVAELRREIDGLEERTRVLEDKEIAGTDANSAIGEENERGAVVGAVGARPRRRAGPHERKLDELRADLQGKFDLLSAENNELRADLQGKFDLLSTENNWLKERIRALEGQALHKEVPEGQELHKEVAAIDVELQLGDETESSNRRVSGIARALVALEDTEDAEETEEHELGDSMWDACLFLGCKDELNLKGASMHVGILVTIFGFFALLVNVLIQSAIVAVVVYKMADNADIKEGTVADMRHVAHDG
jgi:hypothetical protein